MKTQLAEVGVSKKRPFEEVIVDILKSGISRDQLIILLLLMQEVYVPKNHRNITDALDKLCGRFPEFFNDVLATEVLIIRQSMDAELESLRDFTKSRALMIVIEKIIQRYRDRDHSLTESDDIIYKLFELAKRIIRAESDEDFKSAVEDLHKL